MFKFFSKFVFDAAKTIFYYYLLIVAVLYFIQDNLIFRPTVLEKSPDEYGFSIYDEVVIETEDGMSLSSWYKQSENGRPTIIYFHGNAGNISDFADKMLHFAKKGYGVFMLEYRGFGGNAGKPSEEGMLKDASAAVGFIKKDNPESKIIYYGHSLGTGVAALMADKQEPYALILEAPFTSIADVAKGTYWFLPVEKLLNNNFAVIDVIENIKCPLLVLHGEKDKVVPVTSARIIFEKANHPKKGYFYKNAGHMDIYEKGALVEIFQWLDNLDKEETEDEVKTDSINAEKTVTENSNKEKNLEKQNSGKSEKKEETTDEKEK